MNIKSLIGFYLTKLRYSLFFRSFARKTWHKYPHIIHWEKHRKEIDNLKKNNKKNNKKILIAPLVNADQTLICLHSLLGVALDLRGCEVDYLVCDMTLPACTNAINQVINEKEFLKNGPKAVCNSCYDCSFTLFNQIDNNFLKLSNYLKKEDFVNIEKLSNKLTLDEIINFKEENINIGEHCLAGALRFYGIGNINLKKNSLQVLRKYFKSAILTKIAFNKALNLKKYDCVIVDHGLYIPQGIITEVAKNKGVSTKVMWQGYKENSLLLSDGVTYHKSLITESEKDWKQYNFTDSKREKILKYLEERNSGLTDWFSFNKQPDMDWEKFKIENKINKKNIYTLMTNVIWDAQLKFEQNIFKDQMEWILTTLEYFKNKKDCNLIIRVHPAEIRGDVPSDQKIEDEIYKNYGELPEHIKLVKPDNKISSYKLGKESNTILVYATKLSFELPCFGKNVIVSGEAFGKNKGFTYDPTSKENYIKLLDELPFKKELDKEIVSLAQRYAYHFFFRRSMLLNSIEKVENQYPPFRLKDNFVKMFKNKNDPGLEKACESILDDVPAILDV
jgi:hypothetical protein